MSKHNIAKNIKTHHAHVADEDVELAIKDMPQGLSPGAFAAHFSKTARCAGTSMLDQLETPAGRDAFNKAREELGAEPYDFSRWPQ